MVAHIEREDQIERNRTEADEIDLLGHAVVQYLEIGRPEPAHRLPLVGDQDVYSTDSTFVVNTVCCGHPD
jgi:hypothetical protein